MVTSHGRSVRSGSARAHVIRRVPLEWELFERTVSSHRSRRERVGGVELKAKLFIQSYITGESIAWMEKMLRNRVSVLSIFFLHLRYDGNQ